MQPLENWAKSINVAPLILGSTKLKFFKKYFLEIPKSIKNTPLQNIDFCLVLVKQLAVFSLLYIDLLFQTVECSERLISSYLIYCDGYNVTFGKKIICTEVIQYEKIELIQSCHQRFVSMMKKTSIKKLLQQYTIIILHIEQEAYCRKPEIFPFLSTR